jgi:hypothetical protein
MAVQSPPPNITTSTVDAWAHCKDARCPGYGQKPVTALKELVEWTGLALGAGGPGSTALAQIVERSVEYVRFEDPEDVPCPTCGKDREVSLQERPVYPVITGFPQMGLLEAPAFNPDVRNTPADEAHAAEMAEMRKQMAELKAMLKGDT